jgi:predicted GNAT family acetyltransferase
MDTYKAVHKPDRNRFEITESGLTAYVEYYVHDGAVDILHTIVPIGLENRGIGSALVRAAYDWGRKEGLAAVATCSFAHAWLRRHPEYK